jgi:hypothetical protein
MSDNRVFALDKLEALNVTLQSAGWLNVMKPALERELADVYIAWSGGERTSLTRGLSDEALKQYAASVHRLLGWEDIAKRAASRQREQRQMEEQTEPPIEGGNPYQR